MPARARQGRRQLELDWILRLRASTPGRRTGDAWSPIPACGVVTWPLGGCGSTGSPVWWWWRRRGACGAARGGRRRPGGRVSGASGGTDQRSQGGGLGARPRTRCAPRASTHAPPPLLGAPGLLLRSDGGPRRAPCTRTCTETSSLTPLIRASRSFPDTRPPGRRRPPRARRKHPRRLHHHQTGEPVAAAATQRPRDDAARRDRRPGVAGAPAEVDARSPQIQSSSSCRRPCRARAGIEVTRSTHILCGWFCKECRSPTLAPPGPDPVAPRNPSEIQQIVPRPSANQARSARHGPCD